MNKIIILLISITMSSTVLTGCESMTKEDSGQILGGIIGAAVGSRIGKGRGRTAAIVVGAIAGSMIGKKLGKHMDEKDRKKTAHMLERNPTGQSAQWTNPDTGYQYTATPTRTYKAKTGRPCREFTMDANIGGRMEQVYGKACRQPDGSWKIIQ